MRVLVDADGCPVVDITIALCKARHIPCLLLCDTAHQFNRQDAETLVFDKGADSVDYALANRVMPGELVITQDYGLAALCLAKEARVLHPDGWEYTADNIDALLTFRHEAKQFRAAGGKTKGPGKRKLHQNQTFQNSLRSILDAYTSIQG